MVINVIIMKGALWNIAAFAIELNQCNRLKKNENILKIGNILIHSALNRSQKYSSTNVGRIIQEDFHKWAILSYIGSI